MSCVLFVDFMEVLICIGRVNWCDKSDGIYIMNHREPHIYVMFFICRLTEDKIAWNLRMTRCQRDMEWLSKELWIHLITSFSKAKESL